MTSFREDAEERLMIHERALAQIESKIHESCTNLIQLLTRRSALQEAVVRDKNHLEKIKED